MAIDPRDLDDLIAIWRAGSLSAAAKRRKIAASTISPRLQALESALGLRLLDRQACGTQLTDQGREIAAVAEPLAEQLDRVTRVAHALRAGNRTLPVRVSATEFVVSDILAPTLPRLWAAGADFPVHLQSQADVVSLAARDADLAVRMSRPSGASLIVRRLPEMRLGLFASTAYLGNRDRAAIDLRRERLLAGTGVALLAASIAARADSLVELATAQAPPRRTPWLIVHPDLQRQPSVRLVHRWIVAAFDAVAKRRAA